MLANHTSIVGCVSIFSCFCHVRPVVWPAKRTAMVAAGQKEKESITQWQWRTSMPWIEVAQKCSVSGWAKAAWFYDSIPESKLNHQIILPELHCWRNIFAQPLSTAWTYAIIICLRALHARISNSWLDRVIWFYFAAAKFLSISCATYWSWARWLYNLWWKVKMFRFRIYM